MSMPEFTCSMCGHRVDGDNATGACHSCIAAAIAAPTPIPAPTAPVGDDDEPMPSIRKVHNQSFLQIFLWFFLIWSAIIGLIVLFAGFGH
jgi:hypothetical protein